MSFRKEKIYTKSKYFNFYKWIKDNGCEQIYKNRKINSIYFDNLKFSDVSRLNEGVLPRKKLGYGFIIMKKIIFF